jgi:hypothetical protein
LLGVGASDAGLRRGHGISVDLSVGIALLVVACLFVASALLRPLGRELEEAEVAEPDRERRFSRDERSSTGAARVPETR